MREVNAVSCDTEKKNDLTIEYSEQVLEQMEKDPELAAAMRKFAADARQAQQQVNEGKYETVDQAMRELGYDPQRIDGLEEDDEQMMKVRVNRGKPQ